VDLLGKEELQLLPRVGKPAVHMSEGVDDVVSVIGGD
jgi:hypothetical protein